MSDESPSVEKFLVHDWIQKIVGPLVVATVVALVGDRYRLGIHLDDMAGTQLTNKIYIEQLNKFKTEGDRFTFEDGETMKEHMVTLAGECKMATHEIQRLELDIARLPPSKWQDRILRMENELRELRTLMRIGSRSPKKSTWNFKGIDKPDGSSQTGGDVGIEYMDITGNDRMPVRH